MNTAILSGQILENMEAQERKLLKCFTRFLYAKINYAFLKCTGTKVLRSGNYMKNLELGKSLSIRLMKMAKKEDGSGQ